MVSDLKISLKEREKLALYSSIVEEYLEKYNFIKSQAILLKSTHE